MNLGAEPAGAMQRETAEVRRYDVRSPSGGRRRSARISHVPQRKRGRDLVRTAPGSDDQCRAELASAATDVAGQDRSFNSSRAITIRWISLVPSPISRILASRIIRSTGYSRE